MPKCFICGKNYEINSGVSLILLTGDVVHLCSSKCRKNYQMGRNKKSLKWAQQTSSFAEEEEKEEKEAKK